MHLIIMGAPGSGKGSYAVELKKRYGIPHISTGDMFRKAIAEGTELGKIAAFYINDGHLVPDDVTIKIVKKRILEKDCQEGFLFDGFPRTIEQAKALTELLKELNIELDAAINLEIDEEIVKKRIINRRMCRCGQSYNLISCPPKKEGICDICGATLYVRDDDNLETITERLEVYNKVTKPLVEYYDKLGKLISVDSNRTIPEVVEDIMKKLEA